MKVTYTGRHIDLSPAQSRQLETEFEKVGKILDSGRGEAAAHVVLAHEGHMNSVEVTVPYHHHELVGKATDLDLFTALHSAVGKLEAQAIRVREKWRDERRAPKSDVSAEE
jgi:ribosomal subunit interface protein